MSTTPAPIPRFAFVLTVTNGVPFANVEAFEAGVTRLEVAAALAAAMPNLLANAGMAFPTRDETAARQAEAAHVEAHPAVALFAKGGAFLWLGDQAVEVYADLTARGWTSGPVPEGVVKGCDYMRDPSAFHAAYLGGDAPVRSQDNDAQA